MQADLNENQLIAPTKSALFELPQRVRQLLKGCEGKTFYGAVPKKESKKDAIIKWNKMQPFKGLNKHGVFDFWQDQEVEISAMIINQWK